MTFPRALLPPVLAALLLLGGCASRHALDAPGTIGTADEAATPLDPSIKPLTVEQEETVGGGPA